MPICLRLGSIAPPICHCGINAALGATVVVGVLGATVGVGVLGAVVTEKGPHLAPRWWSHDRHTDDQE